MYSNKLLYKNGQVLAPSKIYLFLGRCSEKADAVSPWCILHCDASLQNSVRLRVSLNKTRV